jgi:hypothetical protein
MGRPPDAGIDSVARHVGARQYCLIPVEYRVIRVKWAHEPMDIRSKAT